MNIITNLSLSVAYEETYNFMLIVINKLTKMSHYINYRKNIIAEELTKLFVKEILKHYKTFFIIIFDRDFLFILRF